MIRAILLSLSLMTSTVAASTQAIEITPPPTQLPAQTIPPTFVMLICGTVAVAGVATAAASAFPAAGVAGVLLTVMCGDYAEDGELDFDWGSIVGGRK